MIGPGERLFALLLHAYPREFRARYREDLLAFFRQDRTHPSYGAGWRRPWRFWIATIADLARNASIARREARPVRAPVPVTQRMSRIVLDVRNAWRSLRATPGPTLVALCVLTLGIGASTAMFAVADIVALRDLPFDQPERLVSVTETELPGDAPVTVAAPNYADWRVRAQSFETMGASSRTVVMLKAGAISERVIAVRITPSLMGVLHAKPALGRLFTDQDTQPGATRVVLLSDRGWRRRFGADPNVVGQSLPFDDGPRQVVGVMPAGFVYPVGRQLPGTDEFWLPLGFSADQLTRGNGRTYNLSVIARLRPGVTVAQASAEMQRIRDALAAISPSRWFGDRGVTVRSAHEAAVGPVVRAWMLMLLGAVGLVLLIACVNVANVLLTRATGRGRELGIRAALGATRGDLLRGVMIESLVLGLAGAGLGLGIAEVALAILRATLPAALPRLAAIAIDGRVLLVVLLAGLAAGALFGIVPALRLSRPDFSDALREGGRSNTASASQQRWRSALVVLEVGLAIVLLVGAGFFVSSFARLLRRDLGFDPAGLLMVQVSASRPGIVAGRPAGAPRAPDFMPLVARVAAIPGVEASGALASSTPLSNSSRTTPVTVSWRPEPFGEPDEMMVHEATSGVLAAMRLEHLRGRWIEDGDTANAPLVVLLNDEAARKYLPGREALGEVVTFDNDARTVVGIVADTQSRGPEALPVPEAWVPLAQHSYQSSADLVIRTRVDVGSLMPEIRRAVSETLPGAIVEEPKTFDALFMEFLAQRRFNALLVAVFGALALVMVSVGIYSVMACVVDQRTREIGVRMALGAKPAQVLQMILGRAAGLAGLGLAMGVAGAAGLERSIRSFLYEPTPHDPLVYAAVAALAIGVTLIAAFVPARRAASVDPLVALRRD